MKNARRILPALGILLSLSCARRHPSAEGRDTLYRHLDGDPPTLDPTTTNEELALRVEELIFQYLVGVDKDRQYVPALARSWSVSPDGLAYTFHLDPAARWEGGSPVTSADVSFTIDRIRDPKTGASNWKWGFDDLTAVETPDAQTAVVRFRRPYAERLLAFNLPIVSRSAYAASAESGRHPRGSGPYRLESWESGQKLVLARRDGTSAEAYPYRRVVFRVIPSDPVRLQAGVRGDLDEFHMTREQRTAAARSPDFNSRVRILKVPQFAVVMIVWNVRNPILADVRVRRALAASWNRAEAAFRLYPPEGATLVSGPYPPGVPENASDVPPPKFDAAESARLLDAAGLSKAPDGWRRRAGKRASLEFLYPAGMHIYVNLMEILRGAYARVGIELVPRVFDWATYNKRLAAGEFDVSPAANFFVPPNLDPYPNYHSSQAPPRGANFGFYRDPDADRLMEAAQREVNGGRRLELYRQIHRVLAADPPADFLYGVDQYWGVSRSIERVDTSPLGLFHFLPGPLGWRPASVRN